MKNYEGRKRVVIEHISPQIDGGKYPAKRTVNEPCTVTADIFSDGHDLIRSKLLYRQQGKRKWQESLMEPLGNDVYAATFTPDAMGMWEFTIQGWVDHFESWKHGLKKKFEANQAVEVELQIGVQLMEEGISRLSGAQAKRLQKKLNEFSEIEAPAAGVTAAFDEELAELMYATHYNNPDVSEYQPYSLLDVERERARFSAWYEFFPRSTSREPGQHGNFQTSKEILPRIAEMGFDVVYLPPIHPIGEEHRKGRNNATIAQPGDVGSPWAIGSKEGGHKSIHSELGSMDDFKEFVQEANRQGLEVALDYALQCAPDHPYVKEHPQWFKWRPDGTVQYAENPPKKYQDVLPINFENDDWQNLWKELKSIIDFWIEKGVKIFRVDNPHTKPFHFWEWMIGEVRKKHPEIIFLAEAFTRPRIMERLAKVGFTQSYTYFTWRISQEELKEYMGELTTAPLKDFFRPNFWPNTPDILPPHLTRGGQPAHIVRMLLAATLSGNWGMYGPVYEFGMTQPMPAKEEYIDNEKYEVKHWDWEAQTPIRDAITRINHIRKENDALQYTNNIILTDTDNPNLFAFVKKSPHSENIVLIVVNLDFEWKQSGWIKVPLVQLGLNTEANYKVHDLFSGHSYHWQKEWNYVELNPQAVPAHVFRLEFEQPGQSPQGSGNHFYSE